MNSIKRAQYNAIMIIMLLCSVTIAKLAVQTKAKAGHYKTVLLGDVGQVDAYQGHEIKDLAGWKSWNDDSTKNKWVFKQASGIESAVGDKEKVEDQSALPDEAYFNNKCQDLLLNKKDNSLIMSNFDKVVSKVANIEGVDDAVILGDVLYTEIKNLGKALGELQKEQADPTKKVAADLLHAKIEREVWHRMKCGFYALRNTLKREGKVELHKRLFKNRTAFLWGNHSLDVYPIFEGAALAALSHYPSSKSFKMVTAQELNKPIIHSFK
jgi:hypothetical protein